MDLLKAISTIRRASELPGDEAVCAICNRLHGLSGFDVLLADTLGRVLAAEHSADTPYRKKTGVDGKIYLDSQLSDQFGGFSEMQMLSEMDGFYFRNTTRAHLKNYTGVLFPVTQGNSRLATLLAYSQDHEVTENILILSEICLSLISVLLGNVRIIEEIHSARKNQMVETAIATLSYSELGAILHVFGELSSDEGLVVASKIADNSGLARSVIVNGLRKFESAGVIEVRSLGVKGTYIKVLNDLLIPRLNKMQR